MMMQKLFWGHLLLFVCSCFYLAWWNVAFRPQPVSGREHAGLLLGLTAICGFLAIALPFTGVLFPVADKLFVSTPVVLVAGLVTYIVILFVSARIFGQPVTSELLFIVLWLALELAVLDILQATGLSLPLTWLGLAGIAGVFIVNMACYMLYYRLSPQMAFVSGMIPLGLGGAAALAVALHIWFWYLR
jgi:hypothetical protein